MSSGAEIDRAAPPEVAIVVPCYRYAHLLPDAVRSAAAQIPQPHLRIVIVDDGSPDDTRAVAARLQAELPHRRIDCVQQPNQGLAAARNTGVRATASPMVLPLDADDRLGRRPSSASSARCSAAAPTSRRRSAARSATRNGRW
ncbi:MAG: glycosyltransferase [Planctomycetota bacterium]